MKYICSETTTVLESLPLIKTRLHINNENVEHIWIKYDKATNKMWLQNNAINLYPFHSWGMELDYSSSFDLNDTLNQTEIKIHPETFKSMIVKNIIDNEGNLIKE
jgi:hypothetical protein